MEANETIAKTSKSIEDVGRPARRDLSRPPCLTSQDYGPLRRQGLFRALWLVQTLDMATSPIHQYSAQAVDAMDKVDQAWDQQNPVEAEWLDTLREAVETFIVRAEVYDSWQKRQYREH